MNPVELGQKWSREGVPFVVRQVTDDGEVGYTHAEAKGPDGQPELRPMHFAKMATFLECFTQATSAASAPADTDQDGRPSSSQSAPTSEVQSPAAPAPGSTADTSVPRSPSPVLVPSD